MLNSGRLGAPKLPSTERKKHMATKTTTAGIRRNALASAYAPPYRRKEKARYFPGTAQQGGARAEKAEVPSLEALIQAVLNGNKER
jgi:hypothetical protein